MREFLLTVSPNGSGTITFVASDSASAPVWGTVENNAAKITRTFSGSSRKIYFSLTNAYDGTWDRSNQATIDLSQPGSAGEAEETRTQAPGVMIPGESYYVHAYLGGATVGSSTAVTLLSQPSDGDLPKQIDSTSTPPRSFDNSSPFANNSLANYSYRMAEWLKPGSDREFRDIEIGEEIFLLPIRFILLARGSGLASNSACGAIGGVVNFSLEIPSQGSKETQVAPESVGIVTANSDIHFQVLNHPGSNISRWDGSVFLRGSEYFPEDSDREYVKWNLYQGVCLPASSGILYDGVSWKIINANR